MDAKRNILRLRSSDLRNHTFGNQFSRPNPHDTHSENALTLRIHNELGHSVCAVESHGPARSSPGKSGDFDLTAFLLSLGFCESAPGDFGIGKYDDWNVMRLTRSICTDESF